MISCHHCKSEVDIVFGVNSVGEPKIFLCNNCWELMRGMHPDDYEAFLELKAMTREELDKVDYDLKRWACQCKKCTRGTKVRDYGVSPWFYWPPKKCWVDLTNNFLICAIHWKFQRRLQKSFDQQTIDRKLFDFTWRALERLTDVKFTKTNKINE